MSGRSTSQKKQMFLSIGALSRSVGVPTSTLRTWERRYGFPESVRTPGGHRLYAPEVADTLRWVVRAVEAGHRPAQVLGRSIEELRALCGDPTEAPPEQRGDLWSNTAWVSAIRRLDANRLAYLMSGELASMGLVRFLEERLAPLLVWVGEEWRRGELAIYQEHFFSQCVSSFLTGHWRKLSDLATGPRVVMLTLPGDRHELGLHMAAAVLASSGARLIFLGVDTPVSEVATVCRANVVQAVAVSISAQADAERVRADIEELRALVPTRAVLLLGGSGAPDAVEGAQCMASFSDLAAWCHAEWGSSS